jgi:hypothetical protein
MDAEDLLAKIVVGLILLVAVVFDWPRALGGVLVGLTARRIGWPYLTIPAGVAIVAGVGEVLYAALGYADALSWASFAGGCIAAGATAVGMRRLLTWILNDVEAPQ